MKIVVDDKIPFLKGVLESFSEVLYIPGKQIDRYAVKDADALIVRTRTKCDSSLLEGSTVKFVGTATIGFDHIDTRYCESNGIFWTNAPGCNSSSVQQYIASVLLNLAFERGLSLKDTTLGIVGVGNVGSKVEKMARAIGMNVVLNDPPRAMREGGAGFVSLDELLERSDIVTLHVPLNRDGEDSTFHLFDESMMGRLKSGTFLINSSRGEVVETMAIKNKLREGSIAGSVLDVWEHEPDIDREVMAMTEFSTPHIAGYSTDGKANGTSMIVNALSRFFDLPLKKWYPDDVPTPEEPIMSISCEGKSEQDILRMAVNHTYNVAVDTENLRRSPDDFEKLRGNYRLRREFPAYTLKLVNPSETVARVLSELGFKVQIA